MNLQRLHNRIIELLAIFVHQVKAASAIGRTDINLVAENVLIPLLKEIYGFENLRNLNYTDGANYPGVDLADDSARIAFQITATSGIDKIKDSLKQYVKHELWRRYDRVVVYILSERQKSYSATGFNKIIGDRFRFDPQSDVWDYRTLLKQIVSLQVDGAQRVAELLESNFGTEQRWFAPTAPPTYTALHQLPPPPGDFVGRKSELQELRDSIADGGFIVSGLVGLGGVGKTALALKLAEELTSTYPDAQSILIS